MKIPKFDSTEGAWDFAAKNLTGEAILELGHKRNRCNWLFEKILKRKNVSDKYRQTIINLATQSQLCREAMERIRKITTEETENKING